MDHCECGGLREVGEPCLQCGRGEPLPPTQEYHDENEWSLWNDDEYVPEVKLD